MANEKNSKKNTKKVTASKKNTKNASASKKKTTTKKVAKTKVEKKETVVEPIIQEDYKYVKPAKLKKLETDENKVVKRFIIVLLIVIAGVVGVYFLTKGIVAKDTSKKNKETEKVTFNYDKTILGSVFNRPYDEYYVIIYKSSDAQANYFSTIITNYQNKEDHTKLYFADLDDHMNASFYDKDNVNPNATKASELKVGDYTLIKIKDKKIDKYIEGTEDIASELE